MRILLVDDHALFRDGMALLLKELDPAVQTVHAAHLEEALAALDHDTGIDLVLLDPPFDSDVFERALQAAARAVGANGHVYLEAPRAWADAELAALGLVVKRHLKAGAVHAHWLRPLTAG